MRAFGLIVVGAVSIALIGCGSGSGSSSGGGGGFSNRASEAKAGVFRYALPTNPTALDPAKVQDGDTIDVCQQVFEGLVKWGEDNTVQPNLAEKWDIKDGGKTYVFHLKKGVKFHNGREVKASDFKWAWERVTTRSFGSSTAETYLQDVVGVKEKLAGTAKEVAGAKVIDDYTFEVTIDKPRPYFLGKLTYTCAYVYAKEALPGDGMKDMATVDQMIGTGPFKFEKYVPEEIVILTANKDYHDGAPILEKIERPVIKDANSRLNKFKTGELDLVALERADLPALQKDDKFKDEIKFFDRPAMYYVGLNCDVVPELKDRRVRQAFAMAIDRDKIVNEILGGINKRADSICPPSVFGYREKTNYLPFDIAKAKALLAEAGFPEGKGFPKIPFSYRDGRTDVEIVAQAVQQQLKQNLGIDLQPRKVEWGAYLKEHNSRKMPAFHMRWAADYLDAENFLSTLLASYGNENKINYKNDEYDKLCSEADGILDEARRKELYGKAEDIVLQDAPFIPLYFQRDAEMISSRVAGIRESAFGHLPHTKTSVK